MVLKHRGIGRHYVMQVLSHPVHPSYGDGQHGSDACAARGGGVSVGAAVTSPGAAPSAGAGWAQGFFLELLLQLGQLCGLCALRALLWAQTSAVTSENEERFITRWGCPHFSCMVLFPHCVDKFSVTAVGRGHLALPFCFSSFCSQIGRISVAATQRELASGCKGVTAVGASCTAAASRSAVPWLSSGVL